MRVLVLGAGKSGRAAESLLRARGEETLVLDGDMPFPADVAAFSCAVVSPGIPLAHPWIAACRAHGIPIRSELQLGCAELRRRGVKLLAVTGSKGKSSVVKLVADALNAAGASAVACGNYGLPVCDVARADEVPAFAVVEVSSFMLETTDLPADAFEAAAILNLQDDHLDRHGSRETYHALKRRLLAMAGTGWDLSGGSDGSDGDLRLLAGSYFDNAILRTNGCAAIALLRVAGVSDAAIARAFASFVPLPHRMQEVGVFGGVRYVDDSKATSLAALAAGVAMAGYGVRLIAGGLPKGDDPESVRAQLTDRVRKVYLIGRCAEVFFAAWSDVVDCEICGTMDRAVAAARRDAVQGETVLLSPGTASFDQFKSYGERGDVFAGLVKKEGQGKT